MTIPWNPNLSQRLPAEEQYKLERSKEFLDIEQEAGSLRGKRIFNRCAAGRSYTMRHAC